jgi:hypothetical protein
MVSIGMVTCTNGSTAFGCREAISSPRGPAADRFDRTRRLCTRLLTSGHYDMVPLAEVKSVITGEHLAATTAE